MSDDLGKPLRQVLDDATKNRIYGLLKTDEERKEYAAIERRHADSRDEMERRYREEYAARVEIAQNDLLAKSSQVGHIHPAPPGSPPLTDSDIKRQAHRQVQLAHHANLDRLGRETVESVGALLERAGNPAPVKNMLRGMYGQISFQKNAEYSGPDRRSGIDRRAGQDRRRGPSRSIE